jgi:hypothetical protein
LNANLTNVLLVGGVVAGPLFTVAWLVQGATRADYDPLRYPISSLSLGDAGWVQMATFVSAGLLTFASGLGVRRALPPSGTRWGPALIGLIGIGLIGAGLCVTDPLNGYPPGTPLLPSQRTVHGILHDLFGIPFFLGLPVTGLVFARHFGRAGQRGWAVYSGLSALAMFTVFLVARLGLRPGFEDLGRVFGLFQRVAVTIGWAWLTLLPAYLLTARSRTST